MRTTKRRFISALKPHEENNNESTLSSPQFVAVLALTAARGADLTPAETKTIAEEGFIYGLPIVMNYAVMYEYAVDKNSGQYKAPFNQIKNEARVFTYKDTAIVTPNSDTPYSMLWLDLRAEPIVLSVPAVEKERYYSVMLCDGNTFNYGYIGSRATGNDAGDYMVVGPDWKGETPAGIKKVFRSTTQFSLAVYRTQLFNPDDMPNVVKVQSGYKVQPLSAYLKQPAPAAAPAIDFPKINKETGEDELLRVPRLRPAVRSRRAGGEGNPREAGQHRHRPGKSIQLQGSFPRAEGRRRAGMKDGRGEDRAVSRTAMKNINGWKVGSLFGDRAFYQRQLAAARRGRARQASTATMPSRRCIRSTKTLTPTASRSTAASTTTRSLSPPGSSRR